MRQARSGATASGYGHPDTQPLGLALSAILVMLLLLAAQALLFAPLAIVVHRFVLLGKGASALPARPLGTVLRFALWAAALQFATYIPALLWLLGLPHPTLTGFVVQVVAIVVTIRLTLVFPAVAIEAPYAPAKASWRDTRWRFWRTVSVLFLTELPVFVVFGLALWALARPAVGLAGRAVTASPLLDCLDVPLVATAAAAASWMFIGYRDANDPASRPAEPDPDLAAS